MQRVLILLDYQHLISFSTMVSREQKRKKRKTIQFVFCQRAQARWSALNTSLARLSV